jgi:hypothetical protein
MSVVPEQQVPPKQINYNGAVIDVVPQPGGVMLMISAPACGELLVFPMTVEVAQEIGKKLCAPRVVVPAGTVNGNGKLH